MNTNRFYTCGSALYTDTAASVALLATAILIVLSGVFAGLMQDSTSSSVMTAATASQVTSSPMARS